MTYVSYTPDYEDMILRRALKGVLFGFYFDLSASSPGEGSVTQAFYDIGWRGINITSIAEDFDKLNSGRSRDINLLALSRAQAGVSARHEVPEIKLISMDQATALERSSNECRAIKKEIPVQALKDICNFYQVSQIHFLRIGSEQAKKKILSEVDFINARPWIILIETNPLNAKVDNYDEWETLLLPNNYERVYFNKFSRFYLAREHAQLKKNFNASPDIYDRIIPSNEIISYEQNQKFKIQYRKIKKSISWRITYPMREANNILRFGMCVLRKIKKVVKGGKKNISWLPSLMNNIKNNGQQRQLLIDVSYLIAHDEKTGMQRVARSILRELVAKPPQGYGVRLVRMTATSNGYFYVGDKSEKLIKTSPHDILLGLDLSSEQLVAHKSYLQSLHKSGVLVYFVLHDLIPIKHPEFFSASLVKSFKTWLEAILQFDGVICVSEQVAGEIRAYTELHGIGRAAPFGIASFHHGADIQNSMPSKGMPSDANELLAQIRKKPTFLVVGTLEPRKAHCQTLQAFEQLWSQDIDVNLLFVGKVGWRGTGMGLYLDTPEVAKKIRNHKEFGRRLLWPSKVSDEYLEKIYTASSCLLYPSYAEGFGLPLIEAAKHQLPIIARNIPVFREVAGDCAFYFDDSQRPYVIAAAVLDWLDLYKKGEHPKSENMRWLTWAQSAAMLKKSLLQLIEKNEKAVKACELV